MHKNITIYLLRMRIAIPIFTLFSPSRSMGQSVRVSMIEHRISPDQDEVSPVDVIELEVRTHTSFLEVQELPLEECVALLRSSFPATTTTWMSDKSHCYQIALDPEVGMLLWFDALDKDESAVLLIPPKPRQGIPHPQDESET